MNKLTSFLPASRSCRLFLLVILLEAVADVAIEANLFIRFRFGVQHQNSTNLVIDHSQQRTLPVYLGIFCMAHIYQIVLAFDAAHARNTIQIIGLAIFNLMFLIYAVIQISEIRDVLGTGVVPGSSNKVPVQILTGAIPIIIAAAEIAFCVLTWFIYRAFGDIYKKIGADRGIKRAYLTYQVFLCLLKFGVFFFVAFSLQFVLIVLNSQDVEYDLTIVAVPLSFLLVLAGWYSVRHEIRWLVAVFLTGCTAGMTYFVFKLFRIFTQSKYRDVKASLATFSILAIVNLLGVFIYTVLCLRNFGEGLKYHLSKSERRAPFLRDLDDDGEQGYLPPGKVGAVRLGSANTSRESMKMSRMSLD